jgi:glycosyltransferase involved in cell wall biosynthesis
MYDCQAFIDEPNWAILYKKGHYLAKTVGILKGFARRLGVLFRLRKYDYVFIHREASPIGLPVFEWLIAKVFRKKVIFDFDDAIWLPNTSENNALIAGLKFHQKTGWICRWAHKISAGNDYLAGYARRFNANVIRNPTTIDTENLHNQFRIQQSIAEKPVIGWTGTHSTLKYLDEITPVIRKLELKYDFRFLVISNKKPDIHLDSLHFVQWNKETEVIDLLRMHIGIMPLAADKWSGGKCGFKALQYMALGIPALVSPVGVNTQIVTNSENGFICTTPEDWERNLLTLLQSPELRIDMGVKARAKITKEYSVTANTPNFLQLFK